MRPAIALIAPLLAVPVAAHAAPAPVVCHYFLTDPAGDAFGFAAGVKSPDNDDSMDLEKVDLYATGTTLNLVLKLSYLTTADLMAPTGRLFTITFRPKSGPPRTVKVLIGADGRISNDAGATPTVSDSAYTLSLSLPKVGRATPVSATVERWLGDLATGRRLGDLADEARGAATTLPKVKACK